MIHILKTEKRGYACFLSFLFVCKIKTDRMNWRFFYIVKMCCISLFGGFLMGACGETRNKGINIKLDGISAGKHAIMTLGGDALELIAE